MVDWGKSSDNRRKWEEGNIINRIYKIEEKIGEGSYGQVWRVRNLNTKMAMAVKFPKSSLLLDTPSLSNAKIKEDDIIKFLSNNNNKTINDKKKSDINISNNNIGNEQFYSEAKAKNF